MGRYKLIKILVLLWLAISGVALAVGGVQAYQAYTSKSTDDTSVGLETSCTREGLISATSCNNSTKTEYHCVYTCFGTCKAANPANTDSICKADCATSSTNRFYIRGLIKACTGGTPPTTDGSGNGGQQVPPPPPTSTCNYTAPLGVSSIKTNPEPGKIVDGIANLTMVMGKRNGSVCGGTPKYLIALKAAPVPASGTCAVLNNTYKLAGSFSYAAKTVVTVTSLNTTQAKLDVKFPAVRKDSKGNVLFQFEADKQYCVIAERSNGYKVTRSAPMKISFAAN